MGAPRTSPHGPCFGRERELGLLLGALDHALGGRGRLVLVTGEPGIGKTRLAQELAQHAEPHGVRVLWGHGHEDAGAPALRLWIQILHRHPDGAALVDALRQADAHPLDGAERFRLFDAVTSLLCQHAARTPLLLLLDDLQWVDEPSLQLLQFFAREIATARVLAVATWRDADARPGGVPGDLLARSERVRLGGLDPDAIAALVADRLGPSAGATLADAVVREAKGNPLFARELLSHAAPAHALRVPALLHDVVRRRLAPLSDAARHGLAAAAVIGVEFDAAMLAQVAGMDRETTLGWLDEAVAAELVHLVPDSVARYRFAHGLVHDACLAALSTSQRAALHRRAGEALEAAAGVPSDAYVQALAHHFFEAAVLGDPAKAVRYAEEAGRRALQRYAYEDAARALERGLRAQALAEPDEATRLRLSLRWAHARWRSGDPTARDTLREIAEAVRHLDPLLFGEAALAAALEVVEPDHTAPGVIATLEEALRVTRHGPSTLRAKLLAVLSIRLSSGDALDPRLAGLADEALALARVDGDEQALGLALVASHRARPHPRDLAARTAIARDLLAVAERGQRPLAVLEARVLQAADLAAHGDLPGAGREVDLLWQHAETTRVPLFRWQARVQRTMLLIARGRLDEAEALAHEAYALVPAAARGVAPEILLAQRFAIRRAQGRLDELRDAIDLAPTSGRWGRLWRARRAIAAVERGDVDAGRRGFDALAADGFADVPPDAQWLPTLVYAAELAAALGDGARGAELATLLAPFASQAAVVAGGAVCLGSVAQALGLATAAVGDTAEATTHLEQALHVHERMGAPLLIARATATLAAVLAARDGDDRRRGIELGERAAALAVRLGLEQPPVPLLASRGRPGAARRAVDADGEFRRVDDGWRIGMGGTIHTFRDAKGFRFLARLIARPFQPIPAIDLLDEHAADASAAAPASDAADWMALREELAEAEAHHDLGRMQRLRAQLEDRLAAASPRPAGAADERARVNVTKRIRVAIQQIGTVDPSLARYLDTTIHTGAACSYTPDPRFPVRWRS